MTKATLERVFPRACLSFFCARSSRPLARVALYLTPERTYQFFVAAPYQTIRISDKVIHFYLTIYRYFVADLLPSRYLYDLRQ